MDVGPCHATATGLRLNASFVFLGGGGDFPTGRFENLT